MAKRKKRRNCLSDEEKEQLAEALKELPTIEVGKNWADSDAKLARTLSRKLGFKITASNAKLVRQTMYSRIRVLKVKKAKKTKHSKKQQAWLKSAQNIKNLVKARQIAKENREKGVGRVPSVKQAREAIAKLKGTKTDQKGLETRLKTVEKRVNVIYKALGLK